MQFLYILIGISGSGKSTWAKRHFENDSNTIIVSTDKMRGVLGKNESDQEISHQAFKACYAMTEYLLASGYSVVFDSTALIPKYRKVLLKIAKKYKVYSKAIYFDFRVDFAKSRNSLRSERVVPEEVIDKQFSMLVKPTIEEGYNSVMKVKEGGLLCPI